MIKHSHFVTPRTMNQAFGPYAELSVKPDSAWYLFKLEFWRMFYAITQ